MPVLLDVACHLMVLSVPSLPPQGGDGAVLVERILGDRTFQRELPGHSPPVPSLEERLSPGGEGRARSSPPPLRRTSRAARPPASMDLGPVLRALKWGALALLVLWVVGYIARRVVDLRRSPSRDRQVGEEIVATGQDAPLLPDQPADEIDRLARDGRFAEAIHLLLLRTFEVLARRDEEAFHPSFTSRELVGRLGLEGAMKEALEALVMGVERSLFGSESVSEPDYQACLERYRRLVQAQGATP